LGCHLSPNWGTRRAFFSLGWDGGGSGVAFAQRPKNISQKSENPQPQKTTTQNTTTHHQNTTNSPQITITKTHEIPKTP
jgi:hypothetical protein